MGHIHNPDREYRLLQQRLDRNVTGAPDSPHFIEILKLLFSPGEAAIARQIPTRFVTVGRLARKLDMETAALDDWITEMALRGLVIDIGKGRRRLVSLAPVVIGFFEYTFMRADAKIPLKELARLFDAYMHGNDRFARSVFAADTQIGRSLVREEALPQGDHTEILDWERATRLIETASSASVSLCACRHKASHLGKACDRPMENCIALNMGADILVKNGFARTVSTAEALKILEQCKELGLAQTGDNVRKNAAYICNCCGCCCEMMKAIRVMGVRNAIVTSNWTVEIDIEKCKGCGKCAKLCPVDLIDMVPDAALDGQKPANRERHQGEFCLGCGVCYTGCKAGAIRMKPRPKRVFTPETTFDKIIAMAIERGKLASLVFEGHEQWGWRAFGRVAAALENTPPARALLAIEALRSTFFEAVVRKAKTSL
jgi:Pyruvate/2-oxoacid:ferredoxin oxidoreductase delta subunit